MACTEAFISRSLVSLLICRVYEHGVTSLTEFNPASPPLLSYKSSLTTLVTIPNARRRTVNMLQNQYILSTCIQKVMMPSCRRSSIITWSLVRTDVSEAGLESDLTSMFARNPYPHVWSQVLAGGDCAKRFVEPDLTPSSWNCKLLVSSGLVQYEGSLLFSFASSGG